VDTRIRVFITIDFYGIPGRTTRPDCAVRTAWTRNCLEFVNVIGEQQRMGTFELAVVGLAGSGLGAALGLPMLWPRSQATDARLVGGWLLAVSVLIAIVSGRLLGFVPGNAATEHAINLAGLTAYPLIYLYLRRQTRPAATSRAWWVWVPIGVYALLLPVRAVFDTSTRMPFQVMLPVVLLFTAASAALLVGRERRSMTEFVPAGWLVSSLVVINIAQIIRMVFARVEPIPALVPIVITTVFVGLVGLIAWRASHLLAPAPATPRYERSGLDERAGREVLARVERALSVDRLFTDPSLTLARLADAAGSTPHQVSEVLNRYANVTFHELVARHRVDDVKAQLVAPDADGFTIEGIGASAGFGSRSALYAAFRKAEGVTPAEFRARRSKR
jgi:AraC-like DNA-binding protein